MTQTEHKHIRADRLTSEMFAQVFQAYLECSEPVQAAIRDMVQIVNSSDASQDERESAISTIADALFPGTHNGDWGIDLEQQEI